MKVTRGRPSQLDDFTLDLEEIANRSPDVDGYVLLGVTGAGEAFLLHGAKNAKLYDALGQISDVMASLAEDTEH